MSEAQNTGSNAATDARPIRLRDALRQARQSGARHVVLHNPQSMFRDGVKVRFEARPRKGPRKDAEFVSSHLRPPRAATCPLVPKGSSPPNPEPGYVPGPQDHRRNALGTGIAVYFLATGVNGLQLLGAADYVQQLFYGAALIVAVVLSRQLRRRV